MLIEMNASIFSVHTFLNELCMKFTYDIRNIIFGYSVCRIASEGDRVWDFQHNISGLCNSLPSPILNISDFLISILSKEISVTVKNYVCWNFSQMN